VGRRTLAHDHTSGPIRHAEEVFSFITKATNQTNERQALVGIDKYLKDGTAIPIFGTSYTPVQLKAAIQADLDAASVTQTARASWLLAVQEERTVRATAHGVLLGLKAYLVAQYGKTKVDVLTDFGFTPPKVPRTTPATQVAAAPRPRARRAGPSARSSGWRS
jgi:hypothetical protein